MKFLMGEHDREESQFHTRAELPSFAVAPNKVGQGSPRAVLGNASEGARFEPPIMYLLTYHLHLTPNTTATPPTTFM